MTKDAQRGAYALIEDAIAHLGAALSQSIPSDDQIIMAHVRDALANLRAAVSQARGDS